MARATATAGLAVMSRRGLLWLSTGLAMLGLAGCETIGVYRFRLTVEIDTPGGVRDGSSVLQVRYGLSVNMNGGGEQADVDLLGEAVFVDLGAAGHVIAVLGHPLLLSGAYDRRFLPADVFFPERSGPSHVRQLKAAGGTMRGEAELTPDQFPSLVVYERPADPASARVVYGRGIGKIPDGAGEREVEIHVDEIARVFGAGYGLRGMRVEMVADDTPITREIARRLPWLTDPNVMRNPGWMRLPELARIVINLLRSA